MPSANRASDTLKREESELFFLFAETLILPRKKLTELSKTAVSQARFNLHCCHLTLNRRFPAPAYQRRWTMTRTSRRLSIVAISRLSWQARRQCGRASRTRPRVCRHSTCCDRSVSRSPRVNGADRVVALGGAPGAAALSDYPTRSTAAMRTASR